MKIAKIVERKNDGVFKGKKVDTFKIKFFVKKDIDEMSYFEKTEQLKVDKGVFHWGEYNGFVSFGYRSNFDEPEHRGLWSSNSKDFREQVGIETVEVSIMFFEHQYGGMSIHMRNELLAKLLPSEYKIVRLDNGYDYVIKA